MPDGCHGALFLLVACLRSRAVACLFTLSTLPPGCASDAGPVNAQGIVNKGVHGSAALGIYQHVGTHGGQACLDLMNVQCYTVQSVMIKLVDGIPTAGATAILLIW